MKMTRLHQWAIIVIVTIVALFGMSSSSTASETKDITIWAYDNWAKAAEKAVEIYQNNNPNSGYIFHVVAMIDKKSLFRGTGTRPPACACPHADRLEPV